MTDIKSITADLGVVKQEQKNFAKILKNNQLDNAIEYRPLFGPDGQNYFGDGSAVNIKTDDGKVVTIYNIKNGDTFSGIAQKHHIKQEDLKKANPHIKNASQIQANDFLVLPFPYYERDDQDTINQYNEFTKTNSKN